MRSSNRNLTEDQFCELDTNIFDAISAVKCLEEYASDVLKHTRQYRDIKNELRRIHESLQDMKKCNDERDWSTYKEECDDEDFDLDI